MNLKAPRSSNAIDLIGVMACIFVMFTLVSYAYHRPEVIAIEMFAAATALFLCRRIVKRSKNQTIKGA